MSHSPERDSGPIGRIHPEELQRALERTVDGVAILGVVDGARRFLSVNRAYAGLFGYDAPAELEGVDWNIVHPGDEGERLEERIHSELEDEQSWRGEASGRTRDGEPLSLDLSLTRLGAGRVLCVARDLTEQREVRKRLERMAYYDPLTGLANRRLLREQAGQAFAMAERRGHDVALLYLDLDSFKEINDTLGHAAGDAVLKAVAERLEETVREADLPARVGGDEFAVLLGEVEGEPGAVQVARRVLTGLGQALQVDGHALRVGASIGISFYPRHAADFENLMRRADLAMYGNERSKKVGIRVYKADDSMLVPRHSRLLDELQDALRHYRFDLHYQPIRGLESGRVEGAEALVRWPHPRLGTLSAAKFLPLVEEAGLLRRLDRWVLATAILQLKQWDAESFDGWMAVHVSEASCQDPDLVPYLERTLKAAGGISSERFVLQLPVSLFLSKSERARTLRAELARLGLKTALRAYGPDAPDEPTLHDVAPDLLSLDRSLVGAVRPRSFLEERVQGAIDLAHDVGARVLAKGVEKPGQKEFLQAAGCDYTEGYLEGWSVPAEEFLDGASA